MFVLVSLLLASLWLPSLHALEVLSIPLMQKGKSIQYKLAVNQACHFLPQQNVEVVNLERKSEDDLSFFEEIYFETKELVIEGARARFKISAASNMLFLFDYQNCELKKNVQIGDKLIPFKTMHVSYKDTLGTAVLEKLQFCNAPGECRDIFPYELQGHLPLYELNAGVVFSLRNNLRRSNKATFLKDDPILEPIPTFLFRYATFFLNKDGFGTGIFAYEDALLLATLMYDGEEFESPGYDKRRKGIFLGPIFRWKYLEVKYMRDYFRKKRGQELKISLLHEFRPWNNVVITPNIYAQIWDQRYTDYYLGVDAHEDVSNVYDPKGATNWSAMCRIYLHDKKITYVTDFGVKFFDQQAYDSPIQTDKYELRFAFGVLYKLF